MVVDDERDVGSDDHWYGPVDETYFIIDGRFELDYEAAAAATIAASSS